MKPIKNKEIEKEVDPFDEVIISTGKRLPEGVHLVQFDGIELGINKKEEKYVKINLSLNNAPIFTYEMSKLDIAKIKLEQVLIQFNPEYDYPDTTLRILQTTLSEHIGKVITIYRVDKGAILYLKPKITEDITVIDPTL